MNGLYVIHYYTLEHILKKLFEVFGICIPAYKTMLTDVKKGGKKSTTL